MDARHAKRIEKAVDGAASAILAAAAGYAAFRFGYSVVLIVAAATAAFLASFRMLGLVHVASPAFALEPFEVGPLPAATEVDELLLTDADRLDERAQAPAGDEELVLDDVLASLGEGSRVVRLFDPTAMPSPAELKTRIDRHLESDAPLLSTDASKALHDALSELRRTLR
jgi:hypothetical protein